MIVEKDFDKDTHVVVICDKCEAAIEMALQRYVELRDKPQPLWHVRRKGIFNWRNYRISFMIWKRTK